MAVRDAKWLDGQSVLITTSDDTTGNLWLDGQNWDLLEYVAGGSSIPVFMHHYMNLRRS